MNTARKSFVKLYHSKGNIEKENQFSGLTNSIVGGLQRQEEVNDGR